MRKIFSGETWVIQLLHKVVGCKVEEIPLWKNGLGIPEQMMKIYNNKIVVELQEKEMQSSDHC